MNGDINRSVGTSVICYFCNETIPNGYQLQIHVKQCGSILEKCPHNCGAWIERRNMAQHATQCTRKTVSFKDGASTLPSRSAMGSAIYQVFEDRSRDDKLTSALDSLTKLKSEVDTLKYLLCEEKNQRDELKSEIEKLRRQYALSEERNQIVVTTISALRRHMDDEITKQIMLISEMNNELKKIQSKNQEVVELIKQTEIRVDNLQKTVEFESNERSHLELVINAQDNKLRNLNKLETDVDVIRNEKSQIDSSRNEKIFSVQQELRELKTIISQENLQTKQQMQNIQLLQDEFDRTLRSMSDVKTKCEVAEYDIKTLKAELEEDKATIGMMEKSVESLAKSVRQFQNEEKNVKIIHDIPNVQSAQMNTTGHIMWRIDNYHDKMKDSISNGTIFKSPVFLSHPYGYTLQAELNLNGIGKWQGRHLTATVYIITGEYDSILEWPITLQADVVLKDQTPKRSQSQDIVKSLVVKRKDVSDHRSNESDDRGPSEKSSSAHDTKRQYIFVPHASIDKLDFVKHNTMFIEIIVSKS